MNSEPKKNSPDDLTKTTDKNNVELNEEELGKASGAGENTEFLKIKMTF